MYEVVTSIGSISQIITSGFTNILVWSIISKAKNS